MSKLPKPKYRTANYESLRQRGALMLWIDKDMNWTGEPNGKRGRLPPSSDAAIQFCLMIKSLYAEALRQAPGMVKSLLKLAGLDWDVSDFSRLSRRQKHLKVTLTHQLQAELLHLLVASIGLKILDEGERKRNQLPPPVAQGASGYRCADAGNSCY